MIMVSIKLSDLISLPTNYIENVSKAMGNLKELTDLYLKTDNLQELESIKRRFVADLQYFTELYSRAKRYKGVNHTYFETQIKRIKAEAIELLKTEGLKPTAAEVACYGSPYYTERVNKLEEARSSFIHIEEKYNVYNSTLQAIIQSISVANKEYGNTKSAGQ
jgi:hypothetical protein